MATASHAPLNAAEGPLTGIRVLDLSWVLAGPVVGRLMADAGAQVIKVESEKRLDNTRLGRPFPVEDEAIRAIDRVPLFHTLNAGKLSIGVDLRSERGRDLVLRIARTCDVVVENFAPGVLDRLGLGYEALRALHPEIILLSMSGAGQEGPLSDVPAYAPTVTSLAGLDGLVGYPGEPALGMLGANFADALGGLYGFHAVLTALWARDRHGVGQHVDYSEMDGVCSMLAEPLIDYFMNGRVPPPSGNSHRTGAPYGIFPTQGAERWIAIAVVSDDDWTAFCAATPEQPWTREPAYATPAGRLEAKRELEHGIATYTAERERGELLDTLRRHEVAASPVYTVGEQFGDEHFSARGLLQSIEGVPGVDYATVYGSPWRLSETPVGPRGPGPSLGEHTRQLLGSIVGLSESEIDELIAAEVVA
jgi:benzylsuccinate CoA-transferase BbsF subunit